MLDREHVTDAIRFWERGRVFYNLALITVSLVVLSVMQLDRSQWFSLGFLLLFLAGRRERALLRRLSNRYVRSGIRLSRPLA